MSFDNLPADWQSRPLTDPRLVRDVLDLFIDLRMRQGGTLFALFSGPDHVALTPMAIDEVPGDTDPFEKIAFVHQLVEMGDHFGATGLALAICRPGPGRATVEDEQWADALAAACEDSGRTNLGCHLATPQRVSRISPVPVDVDHQD